MLQLVIFDMDGVLVDACEWHKISLNMALKKICNFEITDEEHYKRFNGLPTKIKLNILADEGKITKESLYLIEKLKQDYTILAIQENAKLREEKIQLMSFLKNKNIKIACYTNSIRMTAELMLEKTGVLKYLDLLITNQDVTEPKPSPEGYKLVLNKLNVLNENTVIIEDSPKGIQAAKLSGCRVVEVKNPDLVNLSLLGQIYG